MPNLYLPILTLFILFLVYALTYIFARKRLQKHNSYWSLTFLFNFIYLIYLTFFYQHKLFDQLGIDSRMLDISILVMTIGVVIHHLAIILEQKYSHRILTLAHGQLSHLLISVPLGINSFAVSIALWQNLSGFLSISLTITYSVASFSYSTYVLLAGFHKVRVPY